MLKINLSYLVTKKAQGNRALGVKNSRLHLLRQGFQFHLSGGAVASDEILLPWFVALWIDGESAVDHDMAQKR